MRLFKKISRIRNFSFSILYFSKLAQSNQLLLAYIFSSSLLAMGGLTVWYALKLILFLNVPKLNIDTLDLACIILIISFSFFIYYFVYVYKDKYKKYLGYYAALNNNKKNRIKKIVFLLWVFVACIYLAANLLCFFYYPVKYIIVK